MIDIKINDKIHGQYTVDIKCNKCKLAVFSGLSNDRERVERVIREQFAKAHLDCEFSAVGSSAVNRVNHASP